MTAYVLHCTVCAANCPDILSWNRHLLEMGHQLQARRKLSEWDTEMRKCGVIVYSSSPLLPSNGSAEIVVNFFSSSGSGGVSGGWGKVIHLTDLILSANRPRTAVLQFESKQIINEIFAVIGNDSSIQVGNQRMQVRKLRKLMDLEWEELLLSLQEEMGEVVPQKVPSKTREENLKTNAEMEGSICPQFRSILEEMEIPDKEFDLAHNVAQEIWQVLGGGLPDFRVAMYMYRHNFLQLRNNFESNVYLLFMYIKDAQNVRGFRAISKQNSKSLLNYLLEGLGRPSKSILNNYAISNKANPTGSEPSGLVQFTHLHLEHQLQLSSYPCSLVELQLSRLTTYYCLFDARLKPLFSLLFFWAKENRVSLGENHISGVQAFSLSPDPVALEWLLLFFLYHRQNLIPTPIQILRRPHNRISLRSNCPEKKDLGFNFDEEFAQEWKAQMEIKAPLEGSSEFLISVLELLQKFFQFYGEELTTPCILRTRDGKIFTKDYIPNSCKFRRLLRGNQTNEGEISRILIIIHPFADCWRLTVDDKKWEESARPVMKTTAGKLGAYVESLKSWMFQSNRSPFLNTLRSALNVSNSD